MSHVHTHATRLLLVGVSVLLGGCISRSPGPNGAGSAHHFFEGTIVYQGFDGPPPGRPFSAQCQVRGDDLRCDWTENSIPMGTLGVDGTNICWRPTFSPRPIVLNLAAVGYFFSLLPPSLTHAAVTKTQGMYRWTGRTEQVLGYRCRELEERSSDGLQLTCYSPDEYYAGDQKAIPILRQMGFDSAFIASISDAGLGWHSTKFDQQGRPTLTMQAVQIAPHPVDPQLVVGVCR